MKLLLAAKTCCKTLLVAHVTTASG